MTMEKYPFSDATYINIPNDQTEASELILNHNFFIRDEDTSISDENVMTHARERTTQCNIHNIGLGI